MSWPPWSRMVPQNLATYVSPEARNWLGLDRSRYDLMGRSDERREVLRAIYDALAARGINYALEPYDPSEALQPIRTPGEILEQPREGTCLDLVLVFCGLCMANDLLPMIVVVEGHAFAAVSLVHGLREWDSYRPERPWFEKGPLEDGARLSELVVGGAYASVECTGFARSDRLAEKPDPRYPETVGRIGGLLPFDRSLAAGAEQFASRPFQFALDVAVAHYGWRMQPLTEPIDRVEPSVIPRQAPDTPPWFVGRNKEMDRLRSLVVDQREPPKLALYGLAGVGKTSLAARVATDPEVENRFPNGTFWLDLRVLDTMGALEKVALAFGYSVSQYTTIDSRAALVRSVLRGRKVLLVYDNVERNDQVTPLLPNSPEAAAVIITIDEGLARLIAVTAIEVPELSEDESIGLIETIVGTGTPPVPRKALRQLVEQLGGLPLALELAAKLVVRQLEKPWGSVDNVIEALGQARGRLDLGLADRQVRFVFTASYDGALDPERRNMFALLGAFAPGALEVGAVAAAWNLDEAEAGRGLDELTALSLVQQTGPNTYRLQTLVRDFANELFEKQPEPDRRRVTEPIIAWYLKWVNNFEESQTQGTVCWYRYVRPEWQDMKRKLLYYLSRKPDHMNARLAFTRLYFDAFWWWGSYVPFSYCDQLLDDFKRCLSEPDDQAWGTLLHAFNRAYPRGTAGADAETWSSVEAALLELARLGSFEGARPEGADIQRQHLWAIVLLFLGQCRRHLDLADPEADAHYRESFALLEANGECWNLAWALFDFADLLIQRRDGEGAEALAARAFTLVHDDRMTDIELKANLVRIQADVRWLRGEVSASFQGYARAVYLGYRFQGTPHDPDYYTFVFYSDLTAYVEARLAELQNAGRADDAAAAAAAVEDVWAPFWASPAAASVTRLGRFPAPPSETKLRARSLRYAREFGTQALAASEAMVGLVP